MKYRCPFALRSPRFALLLFALCALPSASPAQSATATLSGTVTDQNRAVVPNTNVTVVSNATGLKRDAVTNGEGNFTVPLLQPGTYTVRAQHDGFKIVQIDVVILNVGDQKTIQIPLQTGDVSETVNVTGEAPLINTSGAVGTVIDQNTVENIPVNGRSFQTLMALTPGVTFVPTTAAGGQFSVNGQRLNSNYLTVDGVAANTAITVPPTNSNQAAAGQGIGYTVQGSTAGLASLDALKEFRIQTSTYAAEFGRVPGGQVSLVTRSGENRFHGSAFELFRDDTFEANDWFANRSGERAPLSQHMFGGTFSGPIIFPRFGDGDKSWLWNGKDRAWFFFSYEGLRLRLPKFAADRELPTAAYRASAHPSLQPLLNALPLPNSRDLGTGLALGSYGWSDTSEYDATALRIDYNITPSLSIFGRLSETPSFDNIRHPGFLATVTSTNGKSRTFTVGSTWANSKGMANDLRINISRNRASVINENDTFGGAQLPPATLFGSGRSPEDTRFSFVFTGGRGFLVGNSGLRIQRQLNIVDGFTITRGDHTLKFGGDFRRVNPQLWGEGGSNTEQVVLVNPPNIALAQVPSFSSSVKPAHTQAIAFDTLSLYAQDTWRVSPRLSLDLGLRWEIVPPPHATEGVEAPTYANLDNPYGGQVHKNPPGTPFWNTRYDNFAPRFGASYLVSAKQGQELVVRGGFGLYYDLGYGGVATAYDTGDLVASKTCPNAALPECPSGQLAFPLSAAITAAPAFGGRPANISSIDPDIRAPLIYQYNVALERSFGSHQSLSVSFVGADGRRLIRNESINITLPGFPLPASATRIGISRNLGYSDYRALQVQFQRRMHRNIQAQVAYTWSQSRDTISHDDNNTTTPSAARIPIDLDYGNSDFDLRHNFSSALSLRVPKIGGPAIVRALVNGWGLDTKFLVRSGLPITIVASTPFNDPAFPAIENLAVRANLVPGQPIWIENSALPGGRQLNRLAFDIPPANTQGNQPRNSIFGFGARQIDAAVRRNFALSERITLKISAEVFNVTNTPNFANPSAQIAALPTNPVARQAAIDNYGRSTQMLGTGLRGLSPIYQIGGPRSVQFSAKILF